MLTNELANARGYVEDLACGLNYNQAYIEQVQQGINKDLSINLLGGSKGAAPLLPALERGKCNVVETPPFETAGLIKIIDI